MYNHTRCSYTCRRTCLHSSSTHCLLIDALSLFAGALAAMATQLKVFSETGTDGVGRHVSGRVFRFRLVSGLVFRHVYGLCLGLDTFLGMCLDVDMCIDSISDRHRHMPMFAHVLKHVHVHLSMPRVYACPGGSFHALLL